MLSRDNVYRLVVLVCNFEHLIQVVDRGFNPLNAELNPICYLLALLGAHHILHVSRIRVNVLPTALWYDVCLKSELTSIA